jgi:hypothetical protein
MREHLSSPGTPDGRLTERAFALTLLTLFLLTPPIITIFDVPIFVFGIPLLHVYCFSVWLVAIAIGGILSARMISGETNRPPPHSG